MENQGTPRVVSLRWHEVASAPTAVGLYAWYILPAIPAANLQSRRNTEGSVREIARTLRFPEVDLRIEGHLSLDLRGTLAHRHLGDAARDLPDSLEAVLGTATSRQLLADALQASVPWLTAPVYIGVSSNLRRRLGRHQQLMRSTEIDEHVQHPDGAEAAKRDYAFGREIRARRVELNNLLVCLMPIHRLSSSGLSADDLRRTVEGIETLLNRLFYPILGRR